MVSTVFFFFLFLYVVADFLSPVRSRYITTFADYLDKHPSEEPLSALDIYYEQLVSSIEPWSIGKLLQDLQNQHANQATFLHDVCRLVKIYLLADGLLRNPDQNAIDWMAGGVCYIAKHENALTYKITEVHYSFSLHLFHLVNTVYPNYNNRALLLMQYNDFL